MSNQKSLEMSLWLETDVMSIQEWTLSTTLYSGNYTRWTEMDRSHQTRRFDPTSSLKIQLLKFCIIARQVYIIKLKGSQRLQTV